MTTPSYRWWPYVRIARIDHWIKNAFMLLGVVVALFHDPSKATWRSVPILLLAVAATCLVASSNYVLNELLDAETDRHHPEKQRRPAVAGEINTTAGYAEWLILGALGIGIGFLINRYFALSAAALWVMAVGYNVRPVRLKEWPYLDVLSESINNPIRLLLGWFPFISDRLPSVSLIVSYWMAGAFLMAMKRLAEYRHIGDRARAAAYRQSFRHYTEQRLLASVVFYATAAGFFGGIVILRYHLELLLVIPLVAGLFAYYAHIGLATDSPAQHPEKLFRQRAFLTYLLLCAAVFTILMFVRIPALYRWFNVEPPGVNPLWTIGGR